MKFFCYIVALQLNFISLLSHGRVFDFSKESFSSYLQMGYDQVSFKDTAYSQSSGSNVSFNKSYTTSSSYEFGFIYSKKWLGFKIGIEVLKPPDLKLIEGSDASGTVLYNLNNDINVSIPKMGLIFNLYQKPTSRGILSINYGQASLTMANDYTFTSDGTTAYSLPNYKEELKSTTYVQEVALGYEILFTDTTTFTLEGGYRSCEFTSITHNLDLTQSFQGAVAKGDVAKDNNGNPRKFSFSGPFAWLSLRFWIK